MPNIRSNRVPWLLAAGVIGVSLTGSLGAAAAEPIPREPTVISDSAATVSGAPIQEAGAGPASLKPQEQQNYESELSEFLDSSPEPTPLANNASVDEQNKYEETLAAWWETVPWDAVAGQWGCDSVVEEITFNPVNADGVTTASHGGMMQCDEIFSPSELAVVSLPELRSESDFSVLATRCNPPGGDSWCLSTSGTTLTASFQYQGAGNVTGKARAGQPGVGSSCGLGILIATGPVGIGNQGAVWYASGTINQNSYYSSSFIIGSSSIYGTWCATV